MNRRNAMEDPIVAMKTIGRHIICCQARDVRNGKKIEADKAPSGMDEKTFEMQSQKNEVYRSMNYLREECGDGLK